MADPFFLLTLTGSVIGFALYLVFRRLKRSTHPLRMRRRRAAGVPAALTVAVSTAGAAFIIDSELILQWWRWAAVISGAVMLYTWGVLLTPRWWRLPVALLVLVPLVPAIDAWTTLPHRADYLVQPCDSPSLIMRRNGDSHSGEPTLALVRVDPPVRDDELMALRVLPGVRLMEDTSERVWQPAVEVDTTDSVRIVVTLERYPAPLWWLPQSERVSDISFSTGDQTSSLRAPGPRIRWLRDVSRADRDVLVIPGQPELFLQPGVYALEYSCSPADTQNV